MSWFKKKNLRDNGNAVIVSAAREHSIDTEGMNIQVFGATGGTVVQFRRYDRMKDRHDIRLYIISADDNFSEKFAKIVSMEMIR